MHIPSLRIQVVVCVIATMIIFAVGPLWVILPTGILACQQFIWLFNAVEDAATESAVEAATIATLDAIIEIEDATSDADDAWSEGR